MELQHDGPVVGVGHQRKGAVHTAGRRGNELYREIGALSGRECQRKLKARDAKTRSDDIGLADTDGGAANVRNGHDLRAGVADRGADREAVGGHGELWERLGESGTAGDPNGDGKNECKDYKY
jgi:hypothetical protein